MHDGNYIVMGALVQEFSNPGVPKTTRRTFRNAFSYLMSFS
jgi:hypothetical protein